MPKLTDWEAGQDLIYISDTIAEKSRDMRESHPDIYRNLLDINAAISALFDKLGSHQFGISGGGKYKYPVAVVDRAKLRKVIEAGVAPGTFINWGDVEYELLEGRRP